MMDKQPKEITIVYLGSILMPNGEIIHQGKTIGWFKDSKKYLVDGVKLTNAIRELQSFADGMK